MSDLLILDAEAVRRTLTMGACIEAVDSAMRVVSSGGAELPLRNVMALRGTDLLFGSMPGYLSRPASFGAKLLAVRPHPPSGISSHVGVFVLFDADAGRPVAIIDATELTAIRTAAASAVATRALARPDARDLAVLGTGEQAARHVEALAALRPLRSIRVWGRSLGRAQAFAAEQGERLGLRIEVAREAREAVAGADLICTTTSAREPIVFGEWLAPGMHLNLVGSSIASMREADDAVVARSEFFVDYKPSALAQAGELLHAIGNRVIDEGHIRGEIGAVLNGTIAGRSAASEITVYKSLGIAAQDLAAAHRVHQQALHLGIGTRVAF